MKKLLALLMAIALTFQLVTPVFAEEIEETQTATEAVGMETEAPVTEAPTTEPPVPETAAPEETSAPTEPQPTTEVTETTASTEETTTEATEPTEETTEPTLDLFAEDGNVIASGECGYNGDNLIWVLSGDGALTISGEGEMMNYSDSPVAPWYPHRTKILSAVVEDGVMSIGDYALYACLKLTSVSLPDGIESIGRSAFRDCAKLAEMDIPKGVTNIESYAFQGCSTLSGVEIPEGVTNIGDGAFYNCSNLASITIPEGIECIDECTFENCAKLTAITIPKGVTRIGWKAFKDCKALVSVVIPNSVAVINYSAFSGCSSLTGVVIPEGVTRIEGGAFHNCVSLTDIVLPQSVTVIGSLDGASGVFEGCTRLKSVIIPEGVVNIGTHSFSNCNSLTSIVIPEGVMSIGYGAFSGCSSLKSITIPEGITSISAGLFRECSSLTNVTMPASIIDIGDEAFMDCSCLESITIPETVVNIGEWAFRNCGKLKHVEIPDGVGNIADFTFSGCSSLTSIIIPESITSVGRRAFYGCSSLENVIIPENITSIGEGLFEKCSSLTGVTIPASVTDIGDEAFMGCSSLESITIPETVVNIGEWAFGGCDQLKHIEIPEGVGSVANFTFSRCGSLTSITIPGSVTSIGRGAFSECKSLTRITIPEKVAYIGKDAFEGCAKLKSIRIPEGITSIGNSIFSFCEKLESIWLPKSVNCIEQDAFYSCNKLKKVYYSGSKADWSKITIGEYNSALLKASLYCNVAETPGTEIRPVGTTTLTSGGKLTLTAWAMPDNKKVKANWSLSEDSKAYASISSSGVLTAKTVDEVQNITVIATPTDGSLEARKEIQILPKITVKQTEKFNLFYGNGRAKLAVTGGQVASARFVEPSDFVLEDSEGQFYIRLAEGASVKPKTKVTLEITLPGCDTPIKQSLTIATTNTAPKLKLNPTASIVNTTLTERLTVETAILGTEDTLTVRSATKGVTASADNGILTLTLDNGKTTTATVYLKGSDWAKEIRLTHRITVTDKKPTVKLSAKGKLDVLNPASEIVYTPKLANATGTITDVRLEGQDANLFNAEVVDGLVHLTLAKSGENYATKKTYKVTPVVTLLGKDITAPTLSIKVTQSALKLAKLPNRTVYQSQTAPLMVKLAVTSPANAKIGDVQLNAKTTTALRNALENAGGINFEADTVTFPALAFAALNPGRYTVILDVTPANATIGSKPIQAKFTLTVQK